MEDRKQALRSFIAADSWRHLMGLVGKYFIFRSFRSLTSFSRPNSKLYALSSSLNPSRFLITLSDLSSPSTSASLAISPRIFPTLRTIFSVASLTCRILECSGLFSTKLLEFKNCRRVSTDGRVWRRAIAALARQSRCSRLLCLAEKQFLKKFLDWDCWVSISTFSPSFTSMVRLNFMVASSAAVELAAGPLGTVLEFH